MLPEARERALLLTDVHTELHLDLTSTEDFAVEATISFGCTQPGASTFLELNGGTDVTLDGRPAPYADGLWAAFDRYRAPMQYMVGHFERMQRPSKRSRYDDAELVGLLQSAGVALD